MARQKIELERSELKLNKLNSQLDELDQEQVQRERTPSLLYDGKTFDQWQELWKTELKTEKRTECIQALAAFARAGHGEPAVEAILDVAAEYDFSSYDDSPEGKLKQNLLELLSQRLPASLWLPPLLERYETEPNRWTWLAKNLFSRLYTLDPQARSQLLLLVDTNQDLGREAVAALVRSDQELKQTETAEISRRYLTGDKPSPQILVMLGYRNLDLIPEQFELLFHENSEVRQLARRVLSDQRSTSQQDVLKVVGKLLQVLDDPKQFEKHIYAIRALGKISEALSSLKPGGDQIIRSERKRISATLSKIARYGDENLLAPAVYARRKYVSERLPVTLADLADGDNSISDDRRSLLTDEPTMEKLLAEEAQIMNSSEYLRGGGIF